MACSATSSTLLSSSFPNAFAAPKSSSSPGVASSRTLTVPTSSTGPQSPLRPRSFSSRSPSSCHSLVGRANEISDYIAAYKPSFRSKPQRHRCFPVLSSKITTQPLPPKTPPAAPLPPSSLPDHHNEDFAAKALFLDSIGMDSLSLLRCHPDIIASSSSTSLSDLRALFDYLSSTFAFTSTDLRRILYMCPELLSLCIKDVAPVFAFLLREAHVRCADIRRVINRRPRLLVSSVETRLRPTLYFLQGVVGIEDMSRHADMLSSPVEEKFIPRIEYFRNLGFSQRDVVKMFRRLPTLFSYSIKGNLEPKVNYFVVEMGKELKEIREFPQYFSFSLERRIKPRHQMCVEKEVYFPLEVMLKTKEEEFKERLEVCCDSSIPLANSPLYWVSSNSSFVNDDGRNIDAVTKVSVN